MMDFVGIPYVEGGRSYDGVDCWGLAYLFYRDWLNVELPKFDQVYPLKEREALARLIDVEKSTVDVEPVEVPEDGDLVLMQFRGHPVHVGVYVDGGRILHVLSRSESVMESAKSPKLRGRIEGYYRVR